GRGRAPGGCCGHMEWHRGKRESLSNPAGFRGTGGRGGPPVLFSPAFLRPSVEAGMSPAGVLPTAVIASARAVGRTQSGSEVSEDSEVRVGCGGPSGKDRGNFR